MKRNRTIIAILIAFGFEKLIHGNPMGEEFEKFVHPASYGTNSMSFVKRSRSLYEILQSHFEDIDYRFGLLSRLAKHIIKYDLNSQDRNLYPKEAIMVYRYGKGFIEFPKAKSYDSNLFKMNVWGRVNEAFAYLMFYLMFPEVRELFDGTKECEIKGSHFCYYDKTKEGFVPFSPIRIEDESDLMDPLIHFLVFETFAIALFRGKITLPEIITYLDNWRDFYKLYGALHKSVYSYTLTERYKARSEFITENLRTSSSFFAMIKTVFAKTLRHAALSYLVEETGRRMRLTYYEEEFQEIYGTKIDAKRELARTARELNKKYIDKKFSQRLRRLKENSEYLQREAYCLILDKQESGKHRMGLRKKSLNKKFKSRKSRLSAKIKYQTCFSN